MVARWETGQTPTEAWIGRLCDLAKSAGLDDHAATLRDLQVERTRLRPKIEIRTDEETEEVNAVLRILRNRKQYATDYRNLKRLTERARQDNAEVLAAHQGAVDFKRAIIRLHEQGKAAPEIAELFGVHEEAISVLVGFYEMHKSIEQAKAWAAETEQENTK